MQSWSSRGSAIFSITSTTVGFTALAIALTSFFLATGPSSVDVKLFNVNQLYRLDKLQNSINERAIVSFDFDVDYKPLLHWNVKQVFAYVLVEYSTEKFPLVHQIVFNKIMNRTLEHEHKFLLKEDNIVGSFPIDDIGKGLKGNTLKFTLCYEIVPYVGLIYREIGEHSVEYKLPEEYVTDRKVPKKDPVHSDWKMEYLGYGSTMYNYFGN